jgi:hypothetical protein
VPEFRYDPPNAGWALSNHLLGLALLGAWFLGSVAFAVTAARSGGVD